MNDAVEMLVRSISKKLEGHDNQDVFSVLVTLLADLGYCSGISKKLFVSLVVEGLDEAYKAYEENDND